MTAIEQTPRLPGATGALVLADGTVFWGAGLGAVGHTVGEVVFSTGLTGYQETITDPSFAGQIITFTFPHMGNVGTNPDDLEARSAATRGVILRADPTEPSNWRATQPLSTWLAGHGVVGLSGIDTRALTLKIRDGVAPTGVIVHSPSGDFDLPTLLAQAQTWPGLEGMDLAKDVTCSAPYEWTDGPWRKAVPAAVHHIVAVDYGAKHNILRELVSLGSRVTVVPATVSGAEILALKPDGVFLSNGPGDPAATGVYAVPAIHAILASDVPLFGICLGHQLLALALGAKTYKMSKGHRGANQPVQELASGRVEITSQNHGFAVDRASLPTGVVETHVSLFDGSVEGLAVSGKRVFSVQYHPEASPGPTDAHYLFQRFLDHIIAAKAAHTLAAKAGV